MSKSQAIRRNEARQAKRLEIIELFTSIGYTQLNNRDISGLNLNELQELLKYGIKKWVVEKGGNNNGW